MNDVIEAEYLHQSSYMALKKRLEVIAKPRVSWSKGRTEGGSPLLSRKRDSVLRSTMFQVLLAYPRKTIIQNFTTLLLANEKVGVMYSSIFISKNSLLFIIKWSVMGGLARSDGGPLARPFLEYWVVQAQTKTQTNDSISCRK